MCASYGLDPRFDDRDDLLAGDAELLDDLRQWSARNEGQTLLPTGKNLRNLNPIIHDRDGARALELAWWGYLVGGQPARFPSINTRAERLSERKGALPSRALIPATAWFEMQKPNRQWFQFAKPDLELFAMAAVTQPGRTADGVHVTCYSIVMRPATPALAPVHDRMPLLIPAAFATQWLTTDEPPHAVIEAALAASEPELDAVTPEAISRRP